MRQIQEKPVLCDSVRPCSVCPALYHTAVLWAAVAPAMGGGVTFRYAPTYSPTYGGTVSNTDPIHKGVC